MQKVSENVYVSPLKLIQTNTIAKMKIRKDVNQLHKKDRKGETSDCCPSGGASRN